LHLSGHGNAARIELEAEDGDAAWTSTGVLVESLRAANDPLGLIVLSSCAAAGELGDGHALAVALVAAGVPRVVAMQAPVGDEYGTALLSAFYGALSQPDTPLVSRALAEARRASHREGPAEWATVTLVLGAEDRPLLDGSFDLEPLSRLPVHKPTGPAPVLDQEQLIGRRKESRAMMRALRRPVGEAGPPGVVLTLFVL
jgi:hypothetical protein